MIKKIKIIFYIIAKWTGAFLIAKYLTRKKLRILAYHGFSITDEAQFRPQLFMDKELFRKRMEYIAKDGYNVLSLQEAIELLSKNELPHCSVVLTFDDGFYSTWRYAVPVLNEMRFPSTIYVTSYYCLKENPVFRLVIQYMFWKTNIKEINLSKPTFHTTGLFKLNDHNERNKISWMIINHGEKDLDENQRVVLCRKLGVLLDVDYKDICYSRGLSLMTKQEIKLASSSGIDIQLHTHRHVLPESSEEVQREIKDNRQTIEAWTNKQPKHLCYPSGVFYSSNEATLKSVGVYSSVTCESGYNDSKSNLLSLSRFLDGNNISKIEFEAELSGFLEILRKLRSLIIN